MDNSGFLSQVHSENQEQNLELMRKGSTHKVRAKESLIAKKISIEKKLGTLPQDSRKGSLRAS